MVCPAGHPASQVAPPVVGDGAGAGPGAGAGADPPVVAGGMVVVASPSHSIVHFAPVLCFFLLEMKETFRELLVVLTSGLLVLQYDFGFCPCSCTIILSALLPLQLDFLLLMLNFEQENFS